MTHTSRPQPPLSLPLRALFVGALFLTVLGIGSQAAPPAGQGRGHGHGRTLMAEPADGQSDLLSIGDLPRTTRRARRVIADGTSLQGDAATGDDVVDLNLFADVHLRAKRKGLNVTRRNGFVWKGSLLDLPGEASIAVQDSVMTGTVFANDTVYEIYYRGNGQHEVREIIPSEFPSDEDPSADIAIDVPDVPGVGAPGDQVAGDTGSQIDVMVVYTNAARASAGGTASMQTLIDLAIANANTAYANSGIPQRVRLVHTAEVTYTETDGNTDLFRLQNPTDGYLDNVATLRDTYGADVVSLLGNGYGCGLGFMMSTPSSGFAAYAYSVVDRTCAAGNLSLAHEMGHNMGLNHDPGHASGTPAFTYAYGYQQPSGLFRTVMAYPCSAGSCPRLMYFSNPNVSFNSNPTGTSSQNNALALSNTANTVANFRQSVSGSCTYSLTPTSSSVGASGATSSFTVTSQTGCAWTATSSQSWLTITSGSSGSGTGSVGYSVAANTAGTTRSATITAGGKTFTVTQAAAACSFGISPTIQSATSSGGAVSVSVTATASCARTAVSNASWITVTAGASGSGNGTVSLNVAANTASTSRTGTVTIAGQTYTLTQAGVPCTYSLAPASASAAAAGASSTVAMTSIAGCTWTAGSSASWLTVTSGASGSGSGSIGYTAAANTAGTTRSATITAGGKTFTVTQSAATCTYSVSPTATSATSSGGPFTATVTGTTGCSWTASSSASWITVTSGASGAGNGTVSLSVAANAAATSRTGTVTIAGKTVTVTQAAASCSFTLSSDVRVRRQRRRVGDLHRHLDDGLRADGVEQCVVADYHQRLVRIGHRVGGLPRGGQHRRHEPHRDDHRGGQGLHRDAGGRAVQLQRVADLQEHGDCRRNGEHSGHWNVGLLVDSNERRRLGDHRLRWERIRQRHSPVERGGEHGRRIAQRDADRCRQDGDRDAGGSGLHLHRFAADAVLDKRRRWVQRDRDRAQRLLVDCDERCGLDHGDRRRLGQRQRDRELQRRGKSSRDITNGNGDGRGKSDLRDPGGKRS